MNCPTLTGRSHGPGWPGPWRIGRQASGTRPDNPGHIHEYISSAAGMPIILNKHHAMPARSIFTTDLRVVEESHISGKHTDLRISISRLPLMVATGAHEHLPLVIKEVGEVAIAPLGRGSSPSTLETTGESIGTFASTALTRPGVGLIVLGGRSGAIRAGTVGLA